jgi:hypothetical protein
MSLEEEVARLLRQAGIQDPDTIKKVTDQLRDKLGPDAEQLAEQLGQILGKFTKGAVTGGTGVPLDPDLVKKLIEILGPSLSDLLGRLMRRIFGDGSGYDVTSVPPSPYKRQRIKNPTRGVFDFVDDLAPDINLNGSPKIDCVPPDMIRITIDLDVVQREEPIYKVTALVHGSTGAQVASGTKYAGKPPLDKLKDYDPKTVSFELTIDCMTAARNLGIVVVSVLVEDDDGNQMFDMVEVDLMSHLIGDDDNCCKAVKAAEDVRRGLREGLARSMHGISAEDLERLIEKMMPRQDRQQLPTPPAPPHAEPKAPPPEQPKAHGQAAPKVKTLREMLEMPVLAPDG